MNIKKHLLYSICLLIVAVVFCFCAMISCDPDNIMDLIKAKNEVEEEPTPAPTSESTQDPTPETPTQTPTPPTPAPTPNPYPPTNPQPPDGATGVSINTTLCVDVFDPDNDSMDVTFYDITNQIIGIDYDVPSGGRACIQWHELSCGTTYTWYATANDGANTASSILFSFTTRDNQAPDKPDYLQPDNYTSTGINVSLRADVSDPDGDTMDVTFYGKQRNAPVSFSPIATATHVPSGSRPNTQWSDLSYETEYEWYVKACDECKACTDSDIATFNTGPSPTPTLNPPQNRAPGTPSNPQPPHGAWEVGIDPDLCVDVSDPDGDPMDVTFYDMMDVPIATATQVPSGGRACVQWNGLSPDSSYAWSAEADDGDKSTKSPQWSFWTGPTPTPGPAVHCDLSGTTVYVFLRNAPECEGGEPSIMEFDVDTDETVTDIDGADNWEQDGTHVKVWFHCKDGPAFVIQGIDSCPTNFKLNGISIPIEN